MKSNCCKAPVRTLGDVTKYWECTKCSKPCDSYITKKDNQIKESVHKVVEDSGETLKMMTEDNETKREILTEAVKEANKEQLQTVKDANEVQEIMDDITYHLPVGMTIDERRALAKKILCIIERRYKKEPDHRRND